MFSANKSKETASNFNINALVSHVFANIAQHENDIWQHNIFLVTNIANHVVNSAIKLGICDHALIKDVIDCLVIRDSTRTEIQVPSRANFPKEISSSDQAQEFEMLIAPRLHALNHCNTDEVFRFFFSESDPAKRWKLRKLIIKAAYNEDLDFSYLADIISIYTLLQNHKVIESYFDQLESELQHYVSLLPVEKQLPTRHDGEYVLPVSAANPYQQHKILSGYLYQWANDNGFQQKAKLIGLLSKEKFNSLLLSRSFFKDSGVDLGTEHGVWSHALQWYCIIEHQKKTYFLEHTALEVYQELGSSNDPTAYSYVLSVWDMLLDQYNKKTYASPECINKTLIDPENTTRWPLLAESIIRLNHKVSIKYEHNIGYFNHLKQKHAGEQQEGVVARKFE